MERPTRAVNQHQQDTLQASCDVLIVEDDIALGDVMASYLARQGLAVRSAHSGASALRLLGAIRPRVAVLDYHLPGQSGLELARALHIRLPGLPIIVMSGSAGIVQSGQLDKIGIRAFVEKPVPLSVLHRAVCQLLMGAGL